MTKRQQRRRASRELRRLTASSDSGELLCLSESSPTFKFAEGEGADAKLPTFDMLAYGGGAMKPKGFSQPVVLDLDSVEIGAGGREGLVPILREHDSNRVVGHAAVAATRDGIKATGEISGVGEDAAEVVALAQNGYPHQASVGGSQGKLEPIKAGRKVQVNGREFTGPLYVARGAAVREISFVAVGADAGTAVDIAAGAGDTSLKISEEDMNFEQWLKATFDLKPEDLTEAQLGTFKARYDEHLAAEKEKDRKAAIEKAGKEHGELVASMRAEASQEAERIQGIHRVAGQHADILQAAIENGWSVEKTEALALKADVENMRNGRPVLHANGGHSSAEDFGEEQAEIVECAIARSHGLSDEAAKEVYSERALETTDKREFKSYGLHRLFHQTLHAAGMYHPPGSYDDDFIRATFQADKKLEASGFSTMSLPGILSNVANKIMLASYRMHDSIVPFCFGRRSSSDFKPFYSYRLEGSGQLEKIGADGQIKHGGLAEQEYLLQLETYAKMLALTRQMIVNDDLGAFTQVASKLGEMAFKAHEAAATDMIVNPPDVGGNPFFDAAHNNLGDIELSIPGLEQLDNLFGTQTDSEGYPISVPASRLLVPTATRITASQLMRETRIEVSGGTNQVRVLANNPFAGAYDYRSTPWLQNAKIANASATAYYLFADPNTNPAFAVGYLNGRDAPTIQQAETDFNTLGMQWRCFWDFVFGVEDFRFAAKSVGTTANPGP